MGKGFGRSWYVWVEQYLWQEADEFGKCVMAHLVPGRASEGRLCTTGRGGWPTRAGRAVQASPGPPCPLGLSRGAGAGDAGAHPAPKRADPASSLPSSPASGATPGLPLRPQMKGEGSAGWGGGRAHLHLI